MRIRTNTLKYAKLLQAKGISSKSAEAFMTVLSEIEIYNICSSDEVNGMLSESIKEVFVEQDKKLAEQRREFDVSFNALKMELKEGHARSDVSFNAFKLELKEGRNRSDLIVQNLMNEIAANRRWTIATIITVGLSIATYLSALFRLSH
ncbi:MAG: hypothetical protein H0U57_05785 [Tatlockia sp.]|nr:hypothetical protein [Tatlockia sp.]